LVNELRKETQATEEKLLEEVKRAVRKEQQPHLAAVRKKREQVQQEKQRVEEELAAQALARQQETEMLMLKKRFEVEYPEMKIYLVGLTTHGYRQFVGSSLAYSHQSWPAFLSGNDPCRSSQRRGSILGTHSLYDRFNQFERP
jgi:lipid II:glycine glycyltransferase (peptidoglycan interpeptide bridge formation enzyme)